MGAPGGKRTATIAAARGERVSFQACVYHAGPEPVEVAIRTASLAGISVRARRVGCVPVPHHNTNTPADELDGVGHVPGYVPDPLFPDTTVVAASREIAAFWISVDVSKKCRPGYHNVHIHLETAKGQSISMTATVIVSRIVLAKRRGFRVTHWLYADAICDRYDVQPFESRFWAIWERYVQNLVSHGCDTLYVPVFTPSLDGVKRPTQLLAVTRNDNSGYTFNWRHVKRWIDKARSCGIEYFEWSHLFTQWGCEHAIRVYEKRNGTESLLWPAKTSATGPRYRSFLAQFLPALERFLKQEKLDNCSYFHVSDEPHGDSHLVNYRKARRMLRELAPWMKVTDALSDIRFGREGLCDIPVPSIDAGLQFVKEGIPCWTYFCCGPRGRYLNRLLDTPLTKIRSSGWLFYRFGFSGFLHWGYNYWYRSQTRQLIDPFTVTDGLDWPTWSYGDPFEVYPGPTGPIDSIRWEVFAESLQDYALLQTLEIDPDAPMLQSLKSFTDFPRDKRRLMTKRKQLLATSPSPKSL